MAIEVKGPETWQEMLAESKKLFAEAQEIVKDPNSGAEEQAKALEMATAAKSYRDRAARLKDIMEAALDKDGIVAKLTEQQVGGKKAAPQRTSEFHSWGSFLQKVWEAGHPNIKAAPDPRLAYFRDKDDDSRGAEKKDMSGGTGAVGGYLIPAEFQAQLMAVAAEKSLIRSRATIIPMRRRQLDIPVLDQTETTAGHGHWFGGLNFYWAEEASQKTESDANFRQVSLVAHKLIGYTRVSDELVDDSAISLEAFFSGPLGFAGGVAWMEDYAFLRGTGAGQPLGVIDAGATIVVPRAAVNAIAIGDILHMLEHALPGGRFVWIASQSILKELLEMSGPSGNASYVWLPPYGQGFQQGVPGMLLGYPIIFSEKPPALGSKGDIGLYDLSYYVIGDRQATTVESTKFDRWSYDQTSWRVVHRVDGQPWLSTYLTLQDGSTTVSPFVVLGAQSGS